MAFHWEDVMKMNLKEVMLKAAIFLPAVIFFLAGLSKIVDPTASYERFENWGYPTWFATVIGLVELCGAIALMISPLTGLAATVLGIDMLGAMLTHVNAGELNMLMTPLALFMAMAYVAYVKQAEILELYDKVLDFMHIPHQPHHL